MRETQQIKDAHDGTVPTAVVGARQLGRLQHRWNEYCSVADPSNGPIDPVQALRRTGALLNAIGDIITSEQAAQTQAEGTPNQQK